jgi:hypothetical protein
MMPPPPGPSNTQASGPNDAPSSVGAAPAPATPPSGDPKTSAAVNLVQAARRFKEMVPEAAEEITQILDLMQKAVGKIMQNTQPGEPMAPPTGG